MWVPTERQLLHHRDIPSSLLLDSGNKALKSGHHMELQQRSLKKSQLLKM